MLIQVNVVKGIASQEDSEKTFMESDRKTGALQLRDLGKALVQPRGPGKRPPGSSDMRSFEVCISMSVSDPPEGNPSSAVFRKCFSREAAV